MLCMRAGFSLVELSIVLVILGLLTGGILSGQSLIRAAELRSIATEYQAHITAIQTFRNKYMARPGDMRSATRFWGYSGGAGCTNHTATSITSPGTCDGNGDGLMYANNAPNVSTEEAQAWRQMALAGLLEGTYSGVTDASNMPDMPPSRLNLAMWRYRDLGDLTGTVTGTLLTSFALNYGNVLEATSRTSSYPFTPEEAWNIDTKMDDGRPAQGIIIARGWADCTTAAARTELTVDYNLANKSKICHALNFRLR